MREVTVPLGDRSYVIHVGTGLLPRLGESCEALNLGRRCAVLTDHNVRKLYAKTALDSLKSAGFDPILISVPAGERTKNLRIVERCCERLAVGRLERNSFVVALGGGVVGDLAGFVAATYLRGIPFVQVPTSLLAQVDSSVGGKTGVNLLAGKNLVGAFHQPRLVLCDLETLETLPIREFRAGLAEVIKYGIIYDADLFERLERSLSQLLQLRQQVLEEVVARCCEIKAEVVARDEKEGGLRQILNFGHTVGHAIENTVGYGRYLHGEAISIGQVVAARLSQALTGLSADEVSRIEKVLKQAELPTTIRLTPAKKVGLYHAMARDKKVRAGEVRFVLAKRIGEVVWGRPVPEDLLEKILDGLAPSGR